MKITIDETAGRLIVLDADQIRLLDVSAGEPRVLAAHPIPEAHWLAACRDYVMVLSGEVGPAGASIPEGTLTRFDRDLSELGTTAIRDIERRGISLTTDGTRLGLVDWAACRVVIADPVTAERIAGNGNEIPSGISFSPDGRYIIAGDADQGDGDILLFDTTAIDGDQLGMRTLPGPDPSPGLDDAPYFSVFSGSGALAALSNQSWGGRGLFVYDMATCEPAWSVVFDAGDEEDSENWYPYPVAFAFDDSLVLAAQPGTIHAYRAADGEALGTVDIDGETEDGFVVDEGRRRIWTAGESVRSYPIPENWLA